MRILDRIRRVWKENRGISLVEIMCALGVMGLISFSVASMVISSSRSYTRGTTEVNLQQESQFTANLVGNLVMDSIGDIEYTADAVGTTMKIRKTDAEYVLEYVNADNCIYCSMYDTVGNLMAGDQLLAENVTGFHADITDFGSNGNVKMYLGLAQGTRTYAADYTMTSRNGLIHTSTMESAVTIVTENRILMEPSQEVTLMATVIGTTETDLNWILMGNTSADSVVYRDMTGNWKLKMGRDEDAESMTLFAQTIAKKEDGTTPLGQANVSVLLRRVNTVRLSSTLDSGEDMKTGAVYTISASVEGYHLDITGLDSDFEHADRNYKPYVATRNIQWNSVFTVNGAAVWNPADYYTVLDSNGNEGGGTCYYRIRLNQDIQNGYQFMLTATAKHPEGMMGGVVTNKTGVGYDHVYGYWWLFKNYYTYNGDALQRSSDNSLGNFTSFDSLKSVMAAKYYGTGESPFEPRKYHRYRQVLSEDAEGNRTYGPWTHWRKNPENNNDLDINLRPLVLSFDFNRAYEVQVCMTIYDTNRNVTAWPIYGSTPQSGDYIALDVPKESYIMDGIVNPVTVRFNKWTDHLIWDSVTGYGSEDAPYILHMTGSEVTDSFNYASHTGYKENELGNYLTYRMQYFDEAESRWKDVSGGKAEISQQGVHCVMRFRQTGRYRVLVCCSNINSYAWNGSNYIQTPSRSYDLFQTDTGVGIFYYSVQ